MEFKFQIKATDMDEALQVSNQSMILYKKKTEETAVKAFDSCRQEKMFANYMKADFDRTEGLGWNCVVGRNFGSHIVHQTKKFIYFQVRDLYVLLWKA